MSASTNEQKFVADHSLTSALRNLGVTEDQLQQLFFRSNNSDTPFDNWTFRIPEEIPLKAEGLLKAYCTLKWLTFDNPPDSDQKRQANDYLAATLAEPDATLGQKTRNAQRKRARRNRGNVGDKNLTIGEIVKSLCLKPEHHERPAIQLWNHFLSELDANDLSPQEQIAEEKRKTRCTYDFKDRRKSITYGQFENLVSGARKNVKSG